MKPIGVYQDRTFIGWQCAKCQTVYFILKDGHREFMRVSVKARDCCKNK